MEAIVNGQAIARKTILADGQLREVSFDVPVERDKPVRASRRSIEWCLKGVDRCWSQKERFIAPAELHRICDRKRSA